MNNKGKIDIIQENKQVSCFKHIYLKMAQCELVFFKESGKRISNIRQLGDDLLNRIDHYPNVKGSLKKIMVVLNRFEEYIKFADASAFDISTLETINVLEEVAKDLRSTNAVYRRDSRLRMEIVPPAENADVKIPYCLPIMKQALYQIVDNAAKYSPTHSTLKVKKIDMANANRTAIVFANLGPKVYEEELDDIENDIFCKSVRGENAELLQLESGLGLGLTLVDMIVRCHRWIDANVYADSGEIIVSYNDIEYADFSITIEFDNECSGFDDVPSYLNNLQKDIETMFKHELAGSMPELTRLAYECSIQCLNSKSIDKSTKSCAYQLFDTIIDFIFYLESQGVSGRQIGLPHIPADKMLDRFVRWALVYRKGGLPEGKLWEGGKNHAPFTPFLYNSFIVVAQILAKCVADEGKDFTMDSDRDYFRICFEQNVSQGALPENLFRELFQESGLAISISEKIICIYKNEIH